MNISNTTSLVIRLLFAATLIGVTVARIRGLLPDGIVAFMLLFGGMPLIGEFRLKRQSGNTSQLYSREELSIKDNQYLYLLFSRKAESLINQDGKEVMYENSTTG